MSKMRKLTGDAWSAGAAKGFNALFQSTDPFDAPVRTGVEAKALLYPVPFLLDEDAFRGIVAAAHCEGDTSLIVSITEEFRNLDGTTASHWEVQYWEYSEYSTLGRVGVLENAVYSPAGRWGLLISQEQHAVAAGTVSFITSLLKNMPEWEVSRTAFVNDWRYRSRTTNVDVSWVPGVLRHVYGSSDVWDAVS